MPRAWRITKAKHAGNAFDGEGPRLYGSRWTTLGTRVSFASGTLSLAAIEVLVHLQKSSLLAHYVVFTVDFSEELVKELDYSLLPGNWRKSPPPLQAQAIGDSWVKSGSSVLLRVPSAIVMHEHNFLINPAHEDFSTITIGGPVPLDIDPRVFEVRK